MNAAESKCKELSHTQRVRVTQTHTDREGDRAIREKSEPGAFTHFRVKTQTKCV